MTQQAYGIGYSGRSLTDIHRLALQLDADVFDVRFSPRSRNWQFSGRNLQDKLGDRYRHVQAFGNRNYKGGPIEIADFEAGLQQVLDSHRPVILMCVCGDPNRCHRTTVGRMLRERGIAYTELGGKGHLIDAQGRIALQERLL